MAGMRNAMILRKTDQQFKSELEQELIARILPFWMEKTVDVENGGFYGQIFNNLMIDKKAEKGCILNSRILWTFSSAYRVFKDKRYLAIARRAYEYLLEYFWDPEFGGLYFTIDNLGRVVNSHKQVYNLSFGIYGFSEYYRATGVPESLDRAIRLFWLIEQNCYDSGNMGYFEARSRDWTSIDDKQLSLMDLNEQKSMNTHLHLLESYTNLLRVWDNAQLRNQLHELIKVAVTYLIEPQTSHFKLFFDERWNSKGDLISMGHDIEGSWLLYEAAGVLGDGDLSAKVKNIAVAMAQRVYEEGIDPEYGGLFNELENGILRSNVKIWWPQCEAMVGFFNAFQLTGDKHFWEAAHGIWQFIQRYLLDKENGEWFGETTREGIPIKNYYKVGPWKCPYHNGRACMELIARLG
jgi:mannobiose 2-epimerase